MQLALAACLCLTTLGIAMPALPHHSTANFDHTKRVTVTGKVVFFRFTNPHSHIDMEVAGEGGAPVSYKIFTVARTVMTRTGWSEADVKPGDQITIEGNPDRKDPTFMNLTKITFVNGKTWDWDRVP